MKIGSGRPKLTLHIQRDLPVANSNPLQSAQPTRSKRTSAPPVVPGRFLRPPDDKELARIRTIIRDTQSPESCTALTWDSKPRLDIEHVLFVPEMDVDRRRRPDGKMVACPFCSGNHPKCLRFYLLWSADGHLRVVGRVCGPKYFGAQTFHRLQHLAQEKYERARNEEYLMVNLPKLHVWRTEATELHAFADKIQQQQLQFKSNVPAFHSFLSRMVKEHSSNLAVERKIDSRSQKGIRSSSGAQSDYETVYVGSIAGSQFLLVRKRPALIADEILRLLNTLPGKIDEPISEDEILDIVCGEPGRLAYFADVLREAHRNAAELKEWLNNAVNFMSDRNIENLRSFSAHDLVSFRFSVQSNASSFRIHEHGAKSASLPTLSSIDVPALQELGAAAYR